MEVRFTRKASEFGSADGVFIAAGEERKPKGRAVSSVGKMILAADSTV